MHILDIIVFLISLPILWKIIAWGSNREFTEELGTLFGIFIMLVYSIIYIVIFGVYDNNWSDIDFDSFKFNVKLKW